MSKFKRTSVHEFTVDGETVTIVLKPLMNGSAAQVASLEGKGDAREMTVVSSIVRDHIVSMSGLFPEGGGQEVTVEELTSSAYFAGLCAEVFSKLMELAFPKAR